MAAMKDKAIELHNASTVELWRKVRSAGCIPDTDAADELERRFPWLRPLTPVVKNVVAEKCILQTFNLDKWQHKATIDTLMSAADEILRLHNELQEARLLNELKKLGPTPTETRLRNEATDLLNRIDGLKAELSAEKANAKSLRARTESAERRAQSQEMQIRNFRDCVAELSRQSLEGEKS